MRKPPEKIGRLILFVIKMLVCVDEIVDLNDGAIFLLAAGEVDVGKGRIVGKGVLYHRFKAVAEINRGQGVAVCEGILANIADAVGNTDLRKRIAVLEGAVHNRVYALSDGEVGERGAINKCLAVNAGNAASDNHPFELIAAVEGLVADSRHLVGNDNLGQEGAVVKCHTAYFRDPAADGYSCERGASVEAAAGDLGNTVRNCNFGKRGASVEYGAAKVGKASRKPNARKRIAVGKGAVTDRNQPVGQNNLGERPAVGKGLARDDPRVGVKGEGGDLLAYRANKGVVRIGKRADVIAAVILVVVELLNAAEYTANLSYSVGKDHSGHKGVASDMEVFQRGDNSALGRGGGDDDNAVLAVSEVGDVIAAVLLRPDAELFAVNNLHGRAFLRAVGCFGGLIAVTYVALGIAGGILAGIEKNGHCA